MKNLFFQRSPGNANLRGMFQFELPAGIGDDLLPERFKGKPWLFRYRFDVLNEGQSEIEQYQQALSMIAVQMREWANEMGCALKTGKTK